MTGILGMISEWLHKEKGSRPSHEQPKELTESFERRSHEVSILKDLTAAMKRDLEEHDAD
jgi:hypothetical protein